MNENKVKWSKTNTKMKNTDLGNRFAILWYLSKYLQIYIVKEIKQYQQKWLQHVQRMGTNILPKQALRYRPKGQRNLGRPRKRWTDQIHHED
jgi:hypothetical protein